MIRYTVVIVALLLGAGLGLEAQGANPQQRAPDAGPVQMLIQYRAELSLTPRQIALLERIDAEMDRANQPYVAQMSVIRAKIRELGPPEQMTAERRARFDGYIAEARPLMEKIQENNSEAMRRVGEVLTEPQRAWIAQQLRQLEEDTRERNARSPRLPTRGN